MVTSRRWSDELSTKLRLYLVDQNNPNDDVSMFVWARDPDEAQRLWNATAILLHWPVSGGAAYVRQVPIEPPKIASAVEWDSVPNYYVYTAQDGRRIVMQREDKHNYPKG